MSSDECPQAGPTNVNRKCDECFGTFYATKIIVCSECQTKVCNSNKCLFYHRWDYDKTLGAICFSCRSEEDSEGDSGWGYDSFKDTV